MSKTPRSIGSQQPAVLHDSSDGQYLVPRILTSVVTALVPPALGGDGVLRLSDLGTEVDQQRDARGVRQLRALVRRAVQERLHRLPTQVLDHVLPPPPVLVQGARLDIRTKRCLTGVSAPGRPSDQPWTVRRYLEIPRFKASCLVDVLASLEGKEPASGPTDSRGLRPPPGETDHRGVARRQVLSRSFITDIVTQIGRRLPVTESAAEGVLLQLGVAGADASIAGFMAAAEAAGIVAPFRKVQQGGITMLVARKDAPAVSACYTAAVRSMQSWGLASVKQIVRHVRVLHRYTIDSRFARAVLSSLPRFSWLDQKNGWFWFRDRPNRLVRGLGKVFSVVRTIKGDDLLTAILRSYGFRQRPGRQVIENACAQLPGYRVDADCVTIDCLLDRQQWLSPTELALIEILEQGGGAATLSSLPRLAQTWGISLTTLRHAIRRSPVVRMARANLILIGSSLTLGLVEPEPA